MANTFIVTVPHDPSIPSYVMMYEDDVIMSRKGIEAALSRLRMNVDRYVLVKETMIDRAVIRAFITERRI